MLWKSHKQVIDKLWTSREQVMKESSRAAPGALAYRLQRRTTRNANESNLDPPYQKSEITSL